MFWNRNKQKLSELYEQLAALRADVKALETIVSSLRGTVNRKLGGKRAKDIEDEDEDDEGIDSRDAKIIEAFGGEVPIELMEKYKNRSRYTN